MKKIYSIFAIFFICILSENAFANGNFENPFQNRLQAQLNQNISELENKTPETTDNQENTETEVPITAMPQTEITENNQITTAISPRFERMTLWYSKEWRPIEAYFSGSLNEEFFGVFSNIHGGYEWGTYLTAEDMIANFMNSWKKNWLVIPTINPDGLQMAKNDNYQKPFYIQWRENSQKIELNRHFCTKNFKNTKYIKRNYTFYSGKNCMTAPEAKAVKKALDTFRFSNIISLHSQMAALFIPDNAKNDERVKNLQKNLKTILPDYQTHNKNGILTINDQKKRDEYTGLMENYIYEYKNIPTVLVEFAQHGKKENRLLEITKFLQ